MTPHIEAKTGDIAKTVLMPGDPLRAKFIAENYLENCHIVNQVRGILGYTGTFQGKEVTIMASGMGMPSMGIYSYELFHDYDVNTIIRIGSCGTYFENIKPYSLILVEKAYTESNYAYQAAREDIHLLDATKEVNEKIEKCALEETITLHRGNIFSSDVFYNESFDRETIIDKYTCLATEMESFALFYNAKKAGKKAACILTVSDNLVTKEKLTSEEREKAFTTMIELVLKSI